MWARLNYHPRDLAIKFYEKFQGKEHLYKIDGSLQDPVSVTTLIKQYFPSFNSEAVVEKYINKWHNDPTSKYYKLSKEEIINSWNKLKKESSTQGTLLHKNIEKFLNEELEEEPKTKEWDLFKKFWTELKANNPNCNIYRVEWPIYNQKKTLAGCVDLVLKSPDGLILIDWKRTKKIETTNQFNQYGFGPFKGLSNCNYVHYMLQLNIYCRILESSYNFNVKKMLFVVLHPENTNYIIYEVPRVQELVAPLVD